MRKSSFLLLLIVCLNLYFLFNFIKGIADFNYPNSGISVELYAVGMLAVWMVINVILFVVYSFAKKR